MLIIDKKNKDYYDGVAGMGIDKSIIYERQYKSMPIPTKISHLFSEDNKYYFGTNYSFTNGYHKIPDGEYNTSIVIIGFCGELHVGIKFTKHVGYDKSNIPKFEKEIVYDIEEIKNKMDFREEKPFYNKNQYKNKKVRLLNFFNKIKSIDATEIFRKYNTPIFVYGNPLNIDDYSRYSRNINNFHVNPCLKDFQFARVYDPYTAFQKIQMYISGVLGINKDGDNIKMTEKEKINQHGMDIWSFRKPPSK